MARSALKRYPPSIGDPDTDRLYNRAAGTHNHLSLRSCEAFVDEACDHGAIESVGKDESFLRDTVPKIGKQRQCIAWRCSLTRLGSRGHRHRCGID
jgi:hypothetical protein